MPGVMMKAEYEYEVRAPAALARCSRPFAAIGPRAGCAQQCSHPRHPAAGDPSPPLRTQTTHGARLAWPMQGQGDGYLSFAEGDTFELIQVRTRVAPFSVRPKRAAPRGRRRAASRRSHASPHALHRATPAVGPRAS